MKNSLACPKCQSWKLWRIEKFETAMPDGIRDYPMRVVQNRGYKQNVFGVEDGQTTGRFDAYVYAQCGYSEFWAHAFGDLKSYPERGIHLIDTTPQQSEYR